MSKRHLKYKRIKEKIVFSLFGLALLIALAALALIIYFVFSQGMAVINWEFLTGMPRNGMSEGGILPAILGTFYLVLGAIIIAGPMGVLAAAQPLSQKHL